MTPAQLPAGRVHRNHIRAAGGQVQRAIIEDRRRLKGRATPVLDALAEFAGAESPSDLEVADVLRRNLCQRGIAGTARISAVGGPSVRLLGSGMPVARSDC